MVHTSLSSTSWPEYPSDRTFLGVETVTGRGSDVGCHWFLKVKTGSRTWIHPAEGRGPECGPRDGPRVLFIPPPKGE